MSNAHQWHFLYFSLSTCMCVCTCICACMCICMFMCMCDHVLVHLCVQAYACLHMPVCLCVYVCVHACVYVHVCIFMCMCPYMCVCMCLYVHVCVVCMYVDPCYLPLPCLRQHAVPVRLHDLWESRDSLVSVSHRSLGILVLNKWFLKSSEHSNSGPMLA